MRPLPLNVPIGCVLWLTMAPQALAVIVTYDFTGEVGVAQHAGSFNSFGPIAWGTPVAGRFSIDLSVPEVPDPTFPQYPGSFAAQITVAGLSVQTEFPASTSNTSKYEPRPYDTLVAEFGVPPLSGNGWSHTPNGSGLFESVTGFFVFRFPKFTLPDLAHFPTLDLSSIPYQQSGGLLFGAGHYAFPGGEFDVAPYQEERAEFQFHLTSLTLVPEPSSLVLGAIALAGAAAWRVRRRP